MYHLTVAQHNILNTTARNFCLSSNCEDLSDADLFLGTLADEAAILTGKLIEEEQCPIILKKAKELDMAIKAKKISFIDAADKLLEILIGSFTAEADIKPKEPVAMYHLTNDQYGILRTSAHNVCSLATTNDSLSTSFHAGILMDLTAILIGVSHEEQSKASIIAKAVELERANNNSFANAESLLNFIIGEFDYPPSPYDF